MAVAVITVSDTPTAPQSRLATWAALANGDTGQPLELGDYASKTLSVTGTFGAGGSVTLKGSNDGTNYFALTDPQGNALTFTAAGAKSVTELPRLIRPECTAGDGTTAIVCSIF